MSSSRAEIQRAILDEINKSTALFAELESIPEQVEKTVEEFTPVLTGETKKSIEVKHRKTALKKLSTRRVKLGEVYSDEDPAKVNTIEYGRSDADDNGGTPEFAMFRRAAAEWDDKDFEPTKGRKKAPKSNADWDAALGMTD
ncbi:hypothetical protein ACP6C7_18865 [Mycolicibacterium septicum]|uniref:HK97 gp10 family phage protein n=1 Tax=Mycolicibacterium septicum TaxID=98668 RepID=A0ABW9LRN4_9MYCO